MKKLSLFILSVFILSFSFAQQIEAYPTHWFTGFKSKELQIMLRGENVASQFPMVKMSAKGIALAKGVTLKRIERVSNPNYIFLNLTIDATAKPGKFTIPFLKNKMQYELKARRKGNGTSYAQGVTSADIMYLLMPDRFSNGDETNDRVEGYLDQTLRRDTVFNRHGGDLKGVQNHLDYFNDMAITALWLNPVLENDMPNRTEHGYAITNHYNVDKRLGGNKAYKDLVDAAHAKGIKIIQDAIYNHIGLQHFLFKDQPDSSWFHRWPSFTQTNYKDQVLFDPYASKKDKTVMSDGWFVREMPDWNQHNPLVATFLIQNAVWCVEEFGIDGWRIDTYAYNDLEFMNRCNAALYREFPKITIFGETWVHGVINQSFFCENNLANKYKSNLQATTDFQTLFYGIQPAVNEKFGWTEGVNKLYTTAAQDVMYKDPMRQVIFLDNHDIARFYSVVNEDTAKYKLALSWLMTFRGIPQMYYGGEVLMKGTTSPNDGYVRKDFPGGWNGDDKNAFTQQGLTDSEKSIQNFVKTLNNYRKTSSAIKTGKMQQHLPNDGLYVYFRYDNNQTVMCVMNTGDKEKSVNFNDYSERTNGFSKGMDIISKQKIENGFIVKPMEMVALELKK